MKENKYEPIESLPPNAETISSFQAQKPEEYKSAAYVHVKYDRYKFGYKTKKGQLKHAAYPGYDIRNFKGVCFVIPKKEQ